MAKTSTSPPAERNSLGLGILIACAVSYTLVTIFVALRILGRWRQKKPQTTFWPSYGESRFWVFCSDFMIILSWALATTLTGILCYAVVWGEGLHQASLSSTQANTVLEMYFVYQVLYRFAAGTSKIATCFILLAIATGQQKTFSRCTIVAAAFITLTCISCSIATIFQCGTSFAANEDPAQDQSQCVNKFAFWLTHAGLNLFASVILAILPWCLFRSLVYRRKYVVAAVLSGLAIFEFLFGVIRLRGLHISDITSSDLTFGSTTELIVSQLEINFACIASCIPTVIKICEEGFVWLGIHVFRLRAPLNTSVRLASAGGTLEMGLSDLHTIDRMKGSDVYEKRIGGGSGLGALLDEEKARPSFSRGTSAQSGSLVEILPAIR